MQTILSKFTKPNLFSRILNRLLSNLYLLQWTILISVYGNYKSLRWKNFRTLFSPLDRFWADPFIWTKNDKTYLFVEEYMYNTGRGRIACLEIDDKLDVISNTTILERPYHLSYPFIFEYDGKLFMIPETGENNCIELYSCERFPDKWVFEKKIIDNIYAVDATVVFYEGKWWLFANVRSDAGSTFDTLYLYFSDNPISGKWSSHPCNPVIKDIHSARPAGRIFFNERRQLIRPSQDSHLRYGFAINFNRIVVMSEMDYQEVCEHVFKPPLGWKILATHTYNTMGNIVVIDASQYRKKRF